MRGLCACASHLSGCTEEQVDKGMEFKIALALGREGPVPYWASGCLPGSGFPVAGSFFPLLPSSPNSGFRILSHYFSSGSFQFLLNETGGS